MQKLITMSLIGYNHPSQANWSYGIWKIDIIDPSQSYCISYTTKENFGGEKRFSAKIKELTGLQVIETKGVYTKTGHQKITGVSSLPDLESDEFIKTVIDALK